MLEAACDKAQTVLLDQVFFSLNSDNFQQFTATHVQAHQTAALKDSEITFAQTYHTLCSYAYKLLKVQKYCWMGRKFLLLS
jgi:hypothetical protein